MRQVIVRRVASRITALLATALRVARRAAVVVVVQAVEAVAEATRPVEEEAAATIGNPGSL